MENDYYLGLELRSQAERIELGRATTTLIDEDGNDPCLPGGGGAICLGLDAIPERANVEVGISHSSFNRNAGLSGGISID